MPIEEIVGVVAASVAESVVEQAVADEVERTPLWRRSWFVALVVIGIVVAIALSV